jgi:hypothetical protein
MSSMMVLSINKARLLCGVSGVGGKGKWKSSGSID